MKIQSLKKSTIVAVGYAVICRLFGGNKKKVRGENNTISIPGPMKRTRLKIFGSGNCITIKSAAAIRDLEILIHGSKNRIEIDEGCLLTNLTIWIEDDNNIVHIGPKVLFCGKTQIDCIEGTKVTIGADCMFADNVHLRTGDSHSVEDMDGKRINPSMDIVVGDHVWFAANSTILKGVQIAGSSVVGNGAIVTKSFAEGNIALAGNPARIVKRGINWSFDRK